MEDKTRRLNRVDEEGVCRSKPAKPPRKHIESSNDLEKDQDPCPDHQATLNFYCVKCRAVICRDCTVVAHQHSESHKILDTLDALSTLRTQAVSLLRHYTLLNSLHASLSRVHHVYCIMNPSMEPTPLSIRLKEGEILAKVVREAETVVEYGRNLRRIHERVMEWEMGQHEWGDIVFLASRCHLLANITAPSDKVFIRLSDWIMPTPWIHLSHLLQPYLGDPPSKIRDKLSPAVHRKGRSLSPSGVSLGYGADLLFPYNAKEVVTSSLLPYIIFNPDTRYFISVCGPGDLDVTLVVMSMDEHSREYLKRRRNNATKSPGALRFRPSEDALTIVERQLMMGGQHKSRLIASYKATGVTGSTATQLVVKVSLPDVKIVEEGHGLPAVKGGVKKGHLIVDYDAKGRPTLSVVARDIGDLPVLLLGQVTHGLDGLMYQVEAEDNKRAENSGFRAKLRSSVRREEEALYNITFGMDL